MNIYSDDYYEILQVSPNASPEVIHAAYRKLASMYHPDTGVTYETMKKINEAYQVLSNTFALIVYVLLQLLAIAVIYVIGRFDNTGTNKSHKWELNE